MTTSMPPATDAPMIGRGATRYWPQLLIGVALLLGVPARIAFGQDAPLWFDETFSAVIATQPSVGAMVRWCLNELTGPLYYAPLWAWVRVFGASDVSLRLPSLLCSIAAPLAVLRWGHPDRIVRLFWCAIVLLWLPALIFANDARSYAQLFLLGSVQAIAYLRLLRDPTTRRALAWTSVSVLFALTHYYALPIVASQGLLYLALCRWQAVRTWPALLPVPLLLGWMAVHLPFVLGLSARYGAAYVASKPTLLLQTPALVFGTNVQGELILGLIGLSSALLWHAPLTQPVPKGSPMPERALILSSVLAFALVLGMGLIHPGFAPRYLTPFQPALLFGVAWWARWSMRRSVKPAIGLFAVMTMGMAGALVAAVGDRTLDDRHLFNMERPTAWLMQRDVRRLVFVWADPVGVISAPTPDTRAKEGEMGGFFFRRAGRPVAVTVPGTPAGPPSSADVLAAAGTDPNAAILWIANDVQSPRHVVPRLAGAAWECRDFGGTQVTVVACRRPLQAARSASTVRPALETSANPPSIAISSGSPRSVR